MGQYRYPAGKFFLVPNGIHRAVHSPYDLIVLLYLLQCSEPKGKSFPSYKTLSPGLMSRYRADEICEKPPAHLNFKYSVTLLLN